MITIDNSLPEIINENGHEFHLNDLKIQWNSLHQHTQISLYRCNVCELYCHFGHWRFLKINGIVNFIGNDKDKATDISCNEYIFKQIME